MWLARRHTRYSLAEIGGYFGGRDHSTAIHACQTIEARLTEDSRLRRVDVGCGNGAFTELLVERCDPTGVEG